VAGTSWAKAAKSAGGAGRSAIAIVVKVAAQQTSANAIVIAPVAARSADLRTMEPSTLSLMPRRNWIPLLAQVLIGSAGLVASGCAADAHLQRHEFTRLCMGVQTRVVIYATDGATASSGAVAAFDVIARLDAVMSDYRWDSELNRLNASAGGPALPVSDEMLAALSAAQDVAEATDGAFDITIGPLVALWRQARAGGELPSEPARTAALRLVDWRKLIVDQQQGSARLEAEGMKIDLGGIGKAFAAQRAVERLKSRGMERCLVALAGDIVVGEAPPASSGWRIQVGPEASSAGAKALVLRNAAVSTSGAAEQFIEIGGVRHSHIVDPRTGLGVTSGHTATVIAPRGELADALATAASILGPGAGDDWLRRFPGARVIWH